MNDTKKICSIIVLYKHDNIILEQIIDNIYSECSLIVLINNEQSLHVNENIFSREKIILINNSVNMGISVAYNQGILKAHAKNCDYAFLLDQDSLPSEHLIPVLVDKIHNKDITMIGASYIEYDDKFVQTFDSLENLTYSTVTFNIASGSLISIKKFFEVGKYDEDMFMEYFDTDWCLKAKKLNHKLLKLDNKLLHHKIGISSRTLFSKKIHIHHPKRYYHKYRNAILCFKKKYINRTWKILEFFKLIIKLFLYPIYSSNAILTFKYIILGIYDGLLNKNRKVD
tara:strand:- start:1894 stop:2745 length:852 start_codon:yes stop_codon:yes gene_type:complete